MLFLVEAATCTPAELGTLVAVLKSVLVIIQIAIPIGLIIFGTIDLGKAVIASDEKKIAENQKVLLKRVIAAILVFLVATIVSFAMGFVGNNSWRACWDDKGCDYGINTISGKCNDKPAE